MNHTMHTKPKGQNQMKTKRNLADRVFMSTVCEYGLVVTRPIFVYQRVLEDHGHFAANCFMHSTQKEEFPESELAEGYKIADAAKIKECDEWLEIAHKQKISLLDAPAHIRPYLAI